jgi:hypothetical protein
MQVAGAACATCGQKIVSVLSASGCVDCRTAHHHACLKDPKTCPTCRRAFAESSAEQASREGSVIANVLSKGRIYLRIATMVPICTLMLELVLGVWLGTELNVRLGQALFVLLVLTVFLYRGAEWARWLLVIFLGIGIPGCVVLCLRAVRGEDWVSASILGWLGATLALECGLLMTPSVGVFLSELRRR